MSENDDADDVAMDDDTDVVNPYDAVLSSITEARGLVRAAALRGEVPTGGLSAAMIAIKALATVCNTIIRFDEQAFQAALAALHDDGDSDAC